MFSDKSLVIAIQAMGVKPQSEATFDNWLLLLINCQRSIICTAHLQYYVCLDVFEPGAHMTTPVMQSLIRELGNTSS